MHKYISEKSAHDLETILFELGKRYLSQMRRMQRESRLTETLLSSEGRKADKKYDCA